MSRPYDVPPAWPRGLLADPDWQAAIDMGIDVFLLEANLALTPAERVRQLGEMLTLVAKIRGAAAPRTCSSRCSSRPSARA